MLATLAESANKAKQIKKDEQFYTVCRPNTGVQVTAGACGAQPTV